MHYSNFYIYFRYLSYPQKPPKIPYKKVCWYEKSGFLLSRILNYSVLLIFFIGCTFCHEYIYPQSFFTRFHINAVIFAVQIPFFTRIAHFNAIAFFRFLLEYNTGKSQQKNVSLCVSIIANLVIMYLVSGWCSCVGKTLKYIYNFVIKIIKIFTKEFQ